MHHPNAHILRECPRINVPEHFERNRAPANLESKQVMELVKRIKLESKQSMNKRTKRLLASVALAAGTLSTALLVKKKTKSADATGDKWARPGMLVTFRAELMPGHDGSERTYRVKVVLPSGRVLLDGISGEHARNEFERIR